MFAYDLALLLGILGMYALLYNTCVLQDQLMSALLLAAFPVF